jgi:hypothetical protein
MTTVTVNTYTHSVTYVTDNILKTLKDIIALSGLNPGKFVGNWNSNHRAIKAWIESGHLTSVVLEIKHPQTGALIIRWDLTIAYGWGSGDGSFWTDTDAIKFAIKKAGVMPSEADYRIVLTTKPGEPAVDGWSDCSFSSLDGFVRQTVGSAISHNGLGASASYWRKVG